MNVKNFLISFLLLITYLVFSPTALADSQLSAPSANFSQLLSKQENDNRVQILTNYLEKYNSPLAPYAQAFVDDADQYNIDWRLVTAISGVESTFGQHEPENCFNGWGFGIYGDQRLCFYSYYEAIHTISKSLREQYMDKWGATDVYAIGHLYAASPTWASRVTYFMNDISKFAADSTNNPLPISL